MSIIPNGAPVLPVSALALEMLHIPERSGMVSPARSVGMGKLRHRVLPAPPQQLGGSTPQHPQPTPHSPGSCRQPSPAPGGPWMCTAWARLCRNKTRPSISLASCSHGPRAGLALSVHRGNPASKRLQTAAPCPPAACGQPMVLRAGGTWPPGGDGLVWVQRGCVRQGGGQFGCKTPNIPISKGMEPLCP